MKVEIKKNRIKEIDAKVEEAIETALIACAEQAIDYATDIVPVDTGNLRNSITKEYDKSEHVVYIGTDVEYAPYVEFGTYKMEARPYLKPAVANRVEECKKFLQQYLGNIK